MAVISVPTIPAKSYSLSLNRADQPLQFMNGSVVIIAPAIAFWSVRVPFKVLQETNAKAWAAALAQLSKLSNTFYFAVPDYSGPRNGYAGADPLVNGAGQLGTTLAVDGVTISTTILLPGDYIEVGGEFKIVTNTVTSNVSGQASINFEPALRTAPATDSTVDIQSPVITMRLAQSLMTLDVEILSLYNMALEAVEHY